MEMTTEEFVDSGARQRPSLSMKTESHCRKVGHPGSVPGTKLSIDRYSELILRIDDDRYVEIGSGGIWINNGESNLYVDIENRDQRKKMKELWTTWFEKLAHLGDVFE